MFGVYVMLPMFSSRGDCEIMCDVQHWQVLSRTLIWILWVIWRELCGTYPESSRGLVLVLVICCDHFQVLPELEERGR